MDTRGKELFTELVNKIKNDEPFKLMRWGDGEWLTYFETGRASNEYKYNRHGAKNLQKCIDGDFYYGLQNFSKENKRFEIPKRKWVNGDVFHYASIDGRLCPLFKALNGKPVVIVGPKFLRGIEMINYTHFIEVPENNCFEDKERIKGELEDCLVEGVYIFCCAYLANILIYEVDKPNSSMIDLGSLLDIYSGNPHRTYQHAMSDETFKKNICE